MNQKRTEIACISKLEDALIKLGYITPEFSQNDKSPSWDGFVFLYKEKDSDSKKDLERRIPVQIKGHYANPPYSESVSFSADTADLNNYLNETGVLFFVIYVDEDDNFQIYYARLTRLILRRLLKGKQNQDKISIHLEKFPEDKKAAIDIFFNFALDMNLTLPNSDISIVDVFKGKMIGSGFNSFSISYKGIQYKDDPWGAFLNNKNTLCLKNDVTGILIPIETNYDLIICSKENEPISIDGIHYYDTFERTRKSGDILEVKFGKSFSLNLKVTNESVSGKFDYKIQGNLNERITDTKFIIDLLSKKTLSIGNNSCKLPFYDSEINKKDMEYFKQNLNFLTKTDELLKKLYISTELDYDSLTPDDEKTLLVLINTVLLGGKYHRPSTENFYLYKISISNISMLLLAEKINDTSCYLYNFFDAKNKNQYSFKFIDDKEYFIIPKEFVLRADDFCILDNIDYEATFRAIKNHQTSEKLREYTYYFMQEMIEGYKKRSKQKTKLLNCIEKSLDFLAKNVKEYDYEALKNNL